MFQVLDFNFALSYNEITFQFIVFASEGLMFPASAFVIIGRGNEMVKLRKRCVARLKLAQRFLLF
jgi:hypothetical protein